MLVAPIDPMASVRAVRDARRSPRVDVLMRIQGELVAVGRPIVIHNLSRSGFGVVSGVAFAVGETLDFRLVAETGVIVRVTAEAVQTRSHPRVPGQQLTGFRFVPGRLTGMVPAALIDQLIEAITPVGSLL
jgi:hypothetical protein